MTASGAGILLIGLTFLYVQPAMKPTAMGVLYAKLSVNPFDCDAPNAIGHRILTPLISYLLSLRGDLILVTNLLAATALLVLIFRYFRQTTEHVSDAMLATVVIAFSLVTLTTVYYGGYTDSTTYLLMFLMWQYRKKQVLFFVLFFLSMLNRESIIFLLPWLIYLRSVEQEWSWTRLLSGVAWSVIVIGAYLLFRLYWGKCYSGGFSMSHYLSPLLDDPLIWYNRSDGFKAMGIFTVFKGFWLLFLVSVICWFRGKNWKLLISVVLLSVCTFAQMFVAYDSSRMFTMVFPVMIIALDDLLRHERYHIRRWGWGIVVVNLCIPQYYTAAQIIEKMQPFWRHIW